MIKFWKKKQDLVTANIGPQEMQAMLNSLSDVRSRLAAALSGGYDYADTLHNIYIDFGYPGTLNFSNFWNMYRRFGIAKNVVELPTDITWMKKPEIVSDDVQFTCDFEKLVDSLKLWSRIPAVDRRQRVGRYAGLFMRVRDGQAPDMPITEGLNGPLSVMQVVPLYEGQLEVLETDNNPMSENYGLPSLYQFNASNAGNKNEGLTGSFSIHPDRVIIVSEDADNGGIYGKSCLESIYNSLMDLRKILGGGGEGFYKNAAQSVVFNLKDASSAKTNETLLNKFNEQYDEFARNRQRRALWTPGMDAKTLDSSLTNPKEFFFNSLYDVSAGSKIPATILIGQQTGRLASDEDNRSFLSMGNARREDFGTEVIRKIIDWFVERNVLPAAKYDIEWSDLLALSQKEQLDNADKMASINDSQFKSGGDVPFTGDEIREAAGFEPMPDVPPGSEELPEDMDEDGE